MNQTAAESWKQSIQDVPSHPPCSGLDDAGFISAAAALTAKEISANEAIDDLNMALSSKGSRIFLPGMRPSI